MMREEVDQISKQIESDAKIIADYLGIDVPKIELRETSNEGLTLDSKTIIGIKSGYKRKMLIHELIHTKGKRWTHTYPSNFFPAIYPIDELSGFIEKRLFENETEHPFEVEKN